MQTPEETIKFVKEWLVDAGCKTEEEVRANLEAASAAFDAASAASPPFDAAFDAALDAADAANFLFDCFQIAANAADAAQYCVKRYEKLNGKLQDAKKEK